VVAIPNKPIYRRGENGEEYDIVFSEEAIEHMAKSYLREYRQNEVTLQHQEDTEGVYLVEQWLKSDMVYDKSIALGLSRELPIGSWIQTYYVDSNDVWKRIESGELAGFSLECILGLEEFSKVEELNDNNMDIKTDEMSFWNKLKEVMSEVFTSTSLSANKEEELYEDINEQKTEVIETELEEQEPVTETAVETVTEEPVVETPTEPVAEPEPTPEPEPVVEEPKPAEPNPLEELVKNLQQEIEALKEANTGLQEKVKGLEAMPSAKPVNPQAKPNPSDVYSQWREKVRNMI